MGERREVTHLRTEQGHTLFCLLKNNCRFEPSIQCITFFDTFYFIYLFSLVRCKCRTTVKWCIVLWGLLQSSLPIGSHSKSTYEKDDTPHSQGSQLCSWIFVTAVELDISFFLSLCGVLSFFLSFFLYQLFSNSFVILHSFILCLMFLSFFLCVEFLLSIILSFFLSYSCLAFLSFSLLFTLLTFCLLFLFLILIYFFMVSYFLSFFLSFLFLFSFSLFFYYF